MTAILTSKQFDVAPPARDPRVILGILMALLLFIVIGVRIADAGNQPLQLLATAQTVAVFAGVFLLVAWVSQRRAIALESGVLDVRATLYRRRVPVQDIDLAAARVIDLRERGEWRPWIRANGFALPGLRGGWFLSRDLTKPFCLLTDRQRVLLLPLRAGGALLLSAAKPNELLAALKAADDAVRASR